MVEGFRQAEQRREEAARRATELAQQTIDRVVEMSPALGHDPTWTAEEWLGSLNLSGVIADALLEQLRERSGEARLELGFISHVGLSEGEGTHVVRGMLDLGRVLEKLATKIADAARKLQAEMAEKKAAVLQQATPHLAGKFVDEAAYGQHHDGRPHERQPFTLSFGDRGDFFYGLERLVGQPDPVSLRAGMRKDHTEGPDARVEFTAGNYGTTSTSEVEYYFVTDPTPARLEQLSLAAWPLETKLAGSESRSNLCRTPRTLSDFDGTLETIAGRLRAIHVREEFTRDKLVGARLYTGPTFCKYNLVLRGMSGEAGQYAAFLQESLSQLCRGNTYATTLHVINSALTVLSALSRCQYVYRGIAGGTLPQAFHTPATDDGFRGGVEYGFMSTTSHREVAVEYSKGGNGLIFEIYMGMVDKGADLSHVSQYPHEAEICFPPLTALEVRRTHIRGSVTVVEVDARVKFAEPHDVDASLAADVEAFRAVDADESGELDLSEFARHARRIVPRLPQPRLAELFAEVDADHDGTISFAEFRERCVPLLQREQEAAAQGQRTRELQTVEAHAKRLEEHRLKQLTASHQRELLEERHGQQQQHEHAMRRELRAQAHAHELAQQELQAEVRALQVARAKQEAKLGKQEGQLRRLSEDCEQRLAQAQRKAQRRGERAMRRYAEMMSASFSTRLREETWLHRRAVAQLAAEKLVAQSADASTSSTLNSTRSRRIAEVARAFEAIVLTDASVEAKSGLAKRTAAARASIRAAVAEEEEALASPSTAAAEVDESQVESRDALPTEHVHA